MYIGNLQQYMSNIGNLLTPCGSYPGPIDMYCLKGWSRIAPVIVHRCKLLPGHGKSCICACGDVHDRNPA